MTPYLSVVIPVFNEVKRIHNLKNIINYLKKQKFKWELIVVDDGSSDKTLVELKKIKQNNQLKILTYQPNRGKGYAVKTGMTYATGVYRLFTDVDLSVPIEKFADLKPWLKRYQVVIGSRRLPDSKLLVRQPFLRERMGKLFTSLSNLLLGTSYSDFTCGFKCFQAASADKIFHQLTVQRWGFDCESLYLAKEMGFRVKEVPVTWSNNAQTKVKFPQDIVNSFLDLVRIRINHILGIYKI